MLDCTVADLLNANPMLAAVAAPIDRALKSGDEERATVLWEQCRSNYGDVVAEAVLKVVLSLVEQESSEE